MFSVITPSYNQGRFVERTIRSVLEQQAGAFEHLVIDGGSDDGTVDVLKRFAHLKWVSRADSGKTSAINEGFARATGDIIAWINSDDLYTPGTFKRVADFFAQNPGAEAVIGRASVIDAEGKRLFDQKEPSAAGFTHQGIIRFWKHGTLPQSSLFFKRSLLSRIGNLDESIWSYMDFDWMLRLSRATRIHRIDQTLSLIRAHASSDTILNIASGVFYDSLLAISKRYWGKPWEPRYWFHAFSYQLHRPRLAWHTHYELFAYEAKEKLRGAVSERGVFAALLQAKRYAFKYPAAFMVMLFRQLGKKLSRGVVTHGH